MPRCNIKIGYIIDYLNTGGTEKQLVELINRLDKKRFSPTLFILRKKENSLIDQVSCDNAIININSMKDIILTNRFINFIRALRHKKIDILQTQFPDSTFIGVLAAKMARVPVTIISRRDIGIWHKKRAKNMYRISNKLNHNWIVNSEAIKNYIMNKENINGSKVDIIYNGVDSQLYRNFIDFNKKNGLTIGIVSNFNRHVKRLDIFINAVILLAKKYEDIKFLVIGKIENKHWKIDLPAKFRQRITFTGETKDIRKYLKKIDIGVLCSDSEGFSNVILEYLASSIPCVCTDIGGNKEIIVDNFNGFLFPAGDFEELYNKVSILIERKDLRKKFAANSLKIVEDNYDWNKIIKEFEGYYTKLFLKK